MKFTELANIIDVLSDELLEFVGNDASDFILVSFQFFLITLDNMKEDIKTHATLYQVVKEFERILSHFFDVNRNDDTVFLRSPQTTNAYLSLVLGEMLPKNHTVH